MNKMFPDIPWVKILVFTENIHFKNSKGEIEEIDNTLIEDKNKKATIYKNKANEFNLSFPSKIEKITQLNASQRECRKNFKR